MRGKLLPLLATKKVADSSAPALWKTGSEKCIGIVTCASKWVISLMDRLSKSYGALLTMTTESQAVYCTKKSFSDSRP